MIKKSALAEIVGMDNVVFEESTLKEYSRDFSFTRAIKPACIVMPRNADEVSRIVGLARETQTPLIPVSSGAPHFRGDTVPGTGGAVIVDLSNLKKVIHITEKTAPSCSSRELLSANWRLPLPKKA